MDDLSLLFDVLSRPDGRDYGSLPASSPDDRRSAPHGLKGWRIGILQTTGFGPRVAHLSIEERHQIHPALHRLIAGGAKVDAEQLLKAGDELERAKAAVIERTLPFDLIVAPTTHVVGSRRIKPPLTKAGSWTSRHTLPCSIRRDSPPQSFAEASPKTAFPWASSSSVGVMKISEF